MTSIKSKKKAVSVVISTLLVLAITIVGALSISNLMSTSALTTVNQTPKAIIASNYVVLTGYDTRDGKSLFSISDLNNEFDGVLCTSCSNPNHSPATGGTDFIVLKLWNKNSNPVNIRSLQVNGILHSWDSNTNTKVLTPSASTSDGGKFPRDGMFSMIPSTSVSLTQQNSQVEGDQEILLLIKLSTSFTSNISLGEPLQILVNVGDVKPAEYIILSGDTK